MKSRKEQHKEEKSSSVVLSIALMCFSGGAAFVNGNAAYITLNRDSAEYAIVRGTLNSGASWGSRPRVSFDYQGEQHELRSAGLLLTKRQLRSIHDELGYIPVSVDKQHPWNAAVCHELTAFGAGCTVLPGLLFLVSLVWFLYHIRRKRQSSRLTLRKAGGIDEFKKSIYHRFRAFLEHAIPANRELHSRFAGIYIDKTHTRH